MEGPRPRLRDIIGSTADGCCRAQAGEPGSVQFDKAQFRLSPDCRRRAARQTRQRHQPRAEFPQASLRERSSEGARRVADTVTSIWIVEAVVPGGSKVK